MFTPVFAGYGTGVNALNDAGPRISLALIRATNLLARVIAAPIPFNGM